MERTTTQPATVHAYYEAQVLAKASGYLTELHVDIGATVKAGDVLAVLGIPEMAKQREAQLATIRRLEADERRAASQWAVSQAGVESYAAKRDKAKAEVAKAEAGLTAARVELERADDLVKQRAVADRVRDEAQKKYDAAAAEKTAAEAAVSSADAELTLGRAQSDAAQADLDVAKAVTDVARRQLEELDELIKYARLTAPFDGVVTQRNVDPGDLVRNSQTSSGRDGQALFVVTKLDNVRIRVSIPERDAPLATEGDIAKVTLQALPGEVFEGAISRSAGVLDEKTRTMLIEIDMPNPDGRLRPGMFGQATITLAPPGDTLTLPANAVRYDENGKSYVYVVDTANQVSVADVLTGLDDGHYIEITAGLNGDERIVGPLLKRLKAGQPVTVN
jgi:RND family efflux transporter MFP subunit